MKCSYSQNIMLCDHPATNIFVWGCAQHHIFEFIACHEHAHAWIQEYADGEIQCAYCLEYALDYIVTGIELATPQALAIFT
jgi:hypothetical protein